MTAGHGKNYQRLVGVETGDAADFPPAGWRALRGTRRGLGRGRFALAAGLLIGLCPGASAGASSKSLEEVAGPERVVLWDKTLQFRAGGGYRDNILLSHVAPEGSALISAELDASFLRLSDTGTELMVFFLGQDNEYLDRQKVGGERTVSTTIRWARPFGETGELCGLGSYLYQYQVMDVSESEQDLRRVLVQGHSISLGPEWEQSLAPGWVADLSLRGQRHLYAGDELDDFWEAGWRYTLAREYGSGSEAVVGLECSWWIYDRRETRALNGLPAEDRGLYYWRPEAFFEWKHFFDRGKRWRTTTKAGWLLNADNGSGYFDYERFAVAQRLKWRSGDWEVSGGARAAWYRYRFQEFAGKKRERQYITVEMRAERRLGGRFLVYANAEREWNRGSDPLDDFRDWLVVGGLGIDL